MTRAFFRGTDLVPAELAEIEAERFAALIDGLGLAGTLHPDKLPPGVARTIVRRHLDSLRALADPSSPDGRDAPGG